MVPENNVYHAPALMYLSISPRYMSRAAPNLKFVFSSLRSCRGMYRITRHRPQSRFSTRFRRSRLFTVLALESSADDTCASVVTSSREILSNVVIKQHDM